MNHALMGLIKETPVKDGEKSRAQYCVALGMTSLRRILSNVSLFGYYSMYCRCVCTNNIEFYMIWVWFCCSSFLCFRLANLLLSFVLHWGIDFLNNFFFGCVIHKTELVDKGLYHMKVQMDTKHHHMDKKKVLLTV